MARNFIAANADKLQTNTIPLSAYPFTFSCWFNVNNVTSEHSLMAISDTAGDVNYWYLMASGSVASDPVRFASRTAGGNPIAATTTSYTADVWNHACAVAASATSRSVFLNGGGKSTNTTNNTPSGLDVFTVGDIVRLTPSTSPADGDIAEVAVWNVALNDWEVELLANGANALAIRPASLVFYAPLFGNDSPEKNVLSTNSLTVTGATKSEHPISYVRGFPTNYNNFQSVRVENGMSTGDRIR